MALLWIEGFEIETIEADLASKYETLDTGGQPFALLDGRFFGNAIDFTNSTVNQHVLETPSLGTVTRFTTGFSVLLDEADGNTRFVEFLDGSDVQCYILLRGATGGVAFEAWTEDGDLIAASTQVLADSSTDWRTIEIQVEFSNTTAGRLELRVNGAVVLLAEDTKTASSGNDQGTAVVWRGRSPTSGEFRIDDIYILDDSGSSDRMKTFLGTMAVKGGLPNSAGSSSDWTPNSGDNHEAVDESGAVDDDTTYVESTTSGDKDLYGIAGLEDLDGDIVGLQVNIHARVGSGSVDVDVVQRGGNGTEENSAAITVSNTSYDHKSAVFETDPDSGHPWELADLGDAEVGIERQ